ncbi:ubiquitin-conjugating enzyme E2 Z [Rhipicephalus sanguineus]|uniref:Ubiquitin-conjugating enzyme E2 Z n=1 Tax=Rhipicephalus sanguineus TaxID=34632 RepID=A0A9D4PDK5_RHISA|nr:ubiquitin-conjugating enzyme E2 Z [Rhipicephalus sanguineus]KAH7936221.1 hypothetical protein HPB52_020161 [Rhipicephalus sanguineus]
MTSEVAEGQAGFPMATTGSSRDIAPLKRDHAVVPCLLRVKRDMADFAAYPPPGVYIAAADNDIANIDAMVIGPRDTPYEGAFFRFLIVFPTTYPIEPPRVRFLTTDTGRVQMHPNLDKNGDVTLSLVSTWSPAQSLSSLLVSLRSMFTADPLYDAPHAVRGQLEYSAECYRQFVRHESVRVAVCDAVESCLMDGHPRFPKPFREVVLRRFLEHYGKYEKALMKQRYLNGSEMFDLIGGTKGNFQHDALLARLRDIKEKVEERNNAVICV